MKSPAPRKPKPPKHLVRWTENVIGGTLYHAYCGGAGLSQRDFTQNMTRKDKRGNIIVVVTCHKCLSYAALASWKIPNLEQKG